MQDFENATLLESGRINFLMVSILKWTIKDQKLSLQVYHLEVDVRKAVHFLFNIFHLSG